MPLNHSTAQACAHTERDELERELIEAYLAQVRSISSLFGFLFMLLPIKTQHPYMS